MSSGENSWKRRRLRKACFLILVDREGRHAGYESTLRGLEALVALLVLRNKAIKPFLAAAQDLRPAES